MWWDPVCWPVKGLRVAIKDVNSVFRVKAEAWFMYLFCDLTIHNVRRSQALCFLLAQFLGALGSISHGDASVSILCVFNVLSIAMLIRFIVFYSFVFKIVEMTQMTVCRIVIAYHTWIRGQGKKTFKENFLSFLKYTKRMKKNNKGVLNIFPYMNTYVHNYINT